MECDLSDNRCGRGPLDPQPAASMATAMQSIKWRNDRREETCNTGGTGPFNEVRVRNLTNKCSE